MSRRDTTRYKDRSSSISSNQPKIGGSQSRNKKIRIKTLDQNPMKSRNNFSQNLKYNIKSSKDNQMMASMTGMKNFGRIKGPKTYYNIYENTGK